MAGPIWATGPNIRQTGECAIILGCLRYSIRLCAHYTQDSLKLTSYIQLAHYELNCLNNGKKSKKLDATIQRLFPIDIECLLLIFLGMGIAFFHIFHILADF